MLLPNATGVHPVRRLDAYLAAAADLARRQWTQFGGALMAAGLVVFVAAVTVQLSACWHLFCSAFRQHAPEQPAAGELAVDAADSTGMEASAAKAGGTAGDQAPGGMAAVEFAAKFRLIVKA